MPTNSAARHDCNTPGGRPPPNDVRTSPHTLASSNGSNVPVQPAALELLNALAPVLSRWGRWYVFGAQAVIAYGVPRLSADVDVTVALAPDDAATFDAIADR